MNMVWNPIHPARRSRVPLSRRRRGLTSALAPKDAATVRRTGLQAAVRGQVTTARGRGAEPRVVVRRVALQAVRAAAEAVLQGRPQVVRMEQGPLPLPLPPPDRKSTRLNSSHI